MIHGTCIPATPAQCRRFRARVRCGPVVRGRPTLRTASLRQGVQVLATTRPRPTQAQLVALLNHVAGTRHSVDCLWLMWKGFDLPAQVLDVRLHDGDFALTVLSPNVRD